MAAKNKSKRGKVPALIRHSSGQARVTLSGKTYYCGRWGSLASQKRSAELLEQWQNNGRRPLERDPDVEQSRSMRAVFAAWEHYLDAVGWLTYRKRDRVFRIQRAGLRRHHAVRRGDCRRGPAESAGSGYDLQPDSGPFGGCNLGAWRLERLLRIEEPAGGQFPARALSVRRVARRISCLLVRKSNPPSGRLASPIATVTEDEGNELLLHTAWLQRLARSVVARRDLAADVAQETMVVAWRRGLDSVLDVRAYLALILRRLASRRMQQEQRERQRERALPPHEPEPSTAELVVKASMHREVVDAVLRLREPYRTAVLLRFLEERSHQEIAAATAAPIETVRTRIKRGLQQLRGDLDLRHGAAPAWAVPILGCAGFNEVAAMATAGAAGTAPGVGVVGAGVLVMGAKVKMALGAAVLLLAWLSWRPWQSEEPTLRPVNGDDPVAAQVSVASVSGERVADTSDSERTAALPSDVAVFATETVGEHRWTITGRVVDEAAGAAVGGAEFAFLVPSAARFLEPVPASADDGRFTIDCLGLDQGFVELTVRHPQFAAVHVPLNEFVARAEAAGGREIVIGDVLVVRGAALAGRVLDADGKTPVAGARLLYYRAAFAIPMQFFTHVQHVTVADADGHFELPFRVGPDHRRHWLVAMTEGGIGWRALDVSRREAESRAFDIALLSGAPLSLRVVDGDGAAVAGAIAVAWIATSPLSSPLDPARTTAAEQPLPAFLRAVTDATGFARLRPPITADEVQVGRAVPGAQCELIVAAPGHRTWRQRQTLAEAAGPTIEVVLSRVADTTLLGVVRTVDGVAIHGANVALGDTEVHTDADGSFRFEHVDVAAGTVQLTASAPGFAPLARQVSCADEGNLIEVDVRLSAARRLAGVVVDQDGVPVAKAWIAGGPGVAGVMSDDSGRFVLDALPRSERMLHVMAMDVRRPFTTVSVPIPESHDELRVVVACHRTVSRVELQLIDRTTGKALEPSNCWLFPVAVDGTQAVGRQLQIRDGLAFDDEAPAGSYTAQLETRDGRRQRQPIEIPVGVSLVRQNVLLDAPATIRCSIDASALTVVPERVRLEVLPAGAGRLTVPGRSGASTGQPFASTLRPAEEREVEVVGAVAGEPITLRVIDEGAIGEVTVVAAPGELVMTSLQLLPVGRLQFLGDAAVAFESLVVQWRRPDGEWSSPQQLSGCRGRRELGAVQVPAGGVTWRVGYTGPDGSQVQREGHVDVAPGTAVTARIE